jgi:streptogramin lyase
MKLSWYRSQTAWLAIALMAGPAAFLCAQSVTEFPIPTAGSGLSYIAPGPDGNLWFIEGNVGKIGRITTAGAVTEFPLASATSKPQSIAPPGRTGQCGLRRLRATRSHG